MHIRKAQEKDTKRVLDLLSQVLEVHAVLRPDLFISGTRKYTEAELLDIFQDENRPVFIAEDENGEVLGYCFCVQQSVSGSNNLRDSRSMYIDDLCVDERYRRQKVGKALCDYAVSYARELGCYDVTLNVWEGNDRALDFYSRMGFTPRKTMMEKIL